MILALTSDALTLRKLSAVADGLGFELFEAGSIDDLPEDRVPIAVIVGLGMTGAIDLIPDLKTRWPQTMVVGVLKIPSAEMWRAAEDRGADLVTTVGVIQRALPERLRNWIENPRGRRLRLFEMADVAGRLGVVARIDDESTGPVAVYHLGADLVAVQDLCPHAGALLSQGEVGLDDGIVTCPEHGSMFDTRSGARLRGPADIGLVTYPVVIEDGQAYLQLESG